MLENEILYKIAISQIEKVGSVLAKTLISYCGGAKEVFETHKKNLIKIPGIGQGVIDSIKSGNALKKAEKILEENNRKGIKTLFYLDDDYPGRLKHHNDCPVVIYAEGTGEYHNSRTLGVVGTRNSTIRAKNIVDSIIRDLKGYDVTIVSGLAFGIDAFAHAAAIENNIPNIAVLGCGINITYPAEHSSMRDDITANGDAISEFALNTNPEKGHFPMRNRIIAGMSDALLVVESDIRGGAIITARLAFDYNKDVFAIPGRIDDKYARGTNNLIRSNIAMLTESAADICRAMNWEGASQPKAVQAQLFYELSEDERKIIEIMRSSEKENIAIDELHYLSGFTVAQLSAILLNMEFNNIIDSLPGSRYAVKKK